jgi:acetyl esterase/lipase
LSNLPKIRFITHIPLPQLGVRRKILLPRPRSSSYARPIAAYLFFARPESELCKTSDLILDFPGGGFVAMSPEHHEERLRQWAVTTGRPVLSLDYGKAPECKVFSTLYIFLYSHSCNEDPYPFAIDEAFDAYRLMTETCVSHAILREIY